MEVNNGNESVCREKIEKTKLSKSEEFIIKESQR